VRNLIKIGITVENLLILSEIFPRTWKIEELKKGHMNTVKQA
jgi:hypothetical protein